MLFFLTLFLQNVKGWSAVGTGIAVLPWTLAFILAARAAPALSKQIGPRRLLIFAAALSAGGLYWLYHLGARSSYAAALLGPLAITGTGVGLQIMPAVSAAMARVRPEDSGAASSMLNISQRVGGAVGLAALGTVVWRTVAQHAGHHGVTTPAYRSSASTARSLSPPESCSWFSWLRWR